MSELPIASTNTLTEGLDQLIHGIETGALSDEDVSRVARRYRESKLSVVTRVMRIGEQIVASDLSERDKTEAIRVMDKLAKLTLSKQLPKEKTKEIVNQLTLDATLPVLPDGKRVDRIRLFGWLKKVASVVAPFELQLSEEDLNQELNRIFSEMNTTSGDTPSPAERKMQIQEFLDGKRDLVSPNLQKLLEKL